uniref:Integrase zinc-binding domain-containing protein n=1 Tax=Amphimedon queenslandica TaxID=400682 RepID=A0A1X7TZE2_AMPQE
MKLFKVTVYVFRFIRLLRKQLMEPQAQELHNIEMKWIKEAKNVLLSDKKFPQWKTQFRLFRDDNGVWRYGCRLANVNASFCTLFPILLPRNHHLTYLIVLQAHERVLHEGIKETVTELRFKYWIAKGRSLVKMTIYRCGLCRRFE